MIPADDLVKLIEGSAKTVKSLSFRNILVLCLLSIIGCGVYSILYLLRTENRNFLVELTGRARIISTVDTCIVAKFYQGNNDHFAITRNYNNTDKAGFYVIAILDNIPETQKEIRAICRTLEEEVNVLKQQAGANPPQTNVINKTKELLAPIVSPTPEPKK